MAFRRKVNVDKTANGSLIQPTEKYKNMRTFLFSLVLLLGACLCIQPLRAQVAATSGSVSGIVRNEKGDPLGGVTVVATSTANGFKAGTTTDPGGEFTFLKLPAVGKYTFSFSSVGFESQTLSDYEIKGNGRTSILVKMKVQAGALTRSWSWVMARRRKPM